tara:strand:- start:583 stop:1143 length:561 start_codon:yes stop_codon:yes gene_type:complete
MNFRIIELIETEKFQYLRIHKNGNTSIKKCLDIHCKDWFQTDRLSETKPRWTVIRDPYKRFLSGLSYDLKRHNVNVKDIRLDNLFTSNETHPRNLFLKNINHSISQIPYLFNTKVEYYIDLDDLNLFLQMHFGESFCENKSNIDTTEIEKHLGKKEIMKYLNMDNYIYNYIKKSPFFWEWQHGKIF